VKTLTAFMLLTLLVCSPAARMADTPHSGSAPAAAGHLEGEDQDEYAPIVERHLDFVDFSLPDLDGKPIRLSEYAAGKRVVLVCFVAGWCQNSNRNGFVVKRLVDRYRDQGLGALVVGEYSSVGELRIHVNRIGIDYPVVYETLTKSERKKSWHYRVRQQADDKRRWGTPFYVILDRRDLLPQHSQGPLARRLYTVSGELREDEAVAFLDRILAIAHTDLVNLDRARFSR